MVIEGNLRKMVTTLKRSEVQYNLRLRKAREVAQKPIKEMEEVTIEDYK